MDVNGTRFHLIKGKRDWETCRVELESGRLVYLREQQGPLRFQDSRAKSESGRLSLSSQLPLFTATRAHRALDISERRGAGVDGFGNWYWISDDRRRIFCLPFGARRPLVYWDQETRTRCAAGDVFVPRIEEHPQRAELAGLAVTEHHYLVAGNVTQSGLFVFDLHAGGEPRLLLFPEQVDFEPFDLAPAPGGGVWILDRSNRTYWGLDRQFRVVSDAGHLKQITPERVFQFHPHDEPSLIVPKREFPNGFTIAANDPVSIESLPDGSVLILDRLDPVSLSDPNGPASKILRYRFAAQQSSPLRLTDQIDVIVEGSGQARRRLNVVAYDIAFADGQLYAVESEGNQAFSFKLDPQSWPTQLRISTDFLPMYYFGSRALVSSGTIVYYDVVGGDTKNGARVTWIKLNVVEQPQYDREGALHTPLLDGRERDCVWHRVFIDACIPLETSVQVWTRAHNDLDLIQDVPFVREPNLYLRGAGAELPFFNPFAEKEVLPDRTGTWEVLFQQAHARYLELRLVIAGNGRVSPHLHAVRVYFPRFSYPKNYMPDVYLQDTESASFLERMLANPEGFFSEIEGKINDISMLFDARSAPPDTLDWLASWLGLMLDPIWAQIQQQRRVNGHAHRENSDDDRRRLLIRFARRLYERRGTPSGILLALHLLLDPCLEETLERLKRIAVNQDLNGSLREQLEKLGLRRPTPAWTEAQFEDLLYQYLLAPSRLSRVRLVERYHTRGGRAVVAGDPTRAGRSDSTTAPDAFAHDFAVLVPEGLSAEEAAMVERLTKLEKPAHVAFDVRRFWDFFRVGETRLGIDTVLGEDSRFQKIVMGRSYLAEGYLYPPHPMDVAERVIADRDRVGQLPAL